MTPSTLSTVMGLLLVAVASAFVAQPPRTAIAFVAHHPQQQAFSKTALFMSTPPPAGGGEDDDKADAEGASLASELFKMAQSKGIGVDDSDLLDDDEEEDEEEEDEDDEEEMNIPQGAINAFLGYDRGDVGDKLSGNVSLTDDQLYSEVKERVLDTAGGFVDFVKGAQESDDDNDDDDDRTDEDATTPKPYQPPTLVPDPDLTAGEVVIVVLEALNNNENPTPNRGVEIFFGYSSPGSSVKQEKGLTPAEYAEFLKETEYKVLFDHKEVVSTVVLICFRGRLFCAVLCFLAF